MALGKALGHCRELRVKPGALLSPALQQKSVNSRAQNVSSTSIPNFLPAGESGRRSLALPEQDATASITI